ncbi:MAG: porin [Bacteroidota bacterium]
MKKILFACFLASTSFMAQAQSDSTDAGKFTISGYLDSYYLAAFNKPKSGNLLGTSQLAGRAFDRLNNQFALGLVQAKFAYSNSKSDMVIDLTFGPNADLGNFGNTSQGLNLWRPSSTYVSSLYGTSAAIKQAYFTYKPTSKLSFTVGQFGTHIGYEVIDAPVNYHYSLSNLFNNGPFYHIGLKAGYAFSDNAALMLGLVNNWDNLTDDNDQKSLIGQFFFKPMSTWSVYLNYIGGYGDDTYLALGGGGNTGPSANPLFTDYTRHLFDITTNFQVTPKFYLGLNAAYGFYSFATSNATDEGIIKTKFNKTSPDWGGVAIYTNYAISDVIGIGVRYEHFQDKNRVRYLQSVNNSLTITAPITLAGGKLQVKPELRMDTSPDKYYEKSSGQGNVDGVTGEGTNSQTTLGVAFIYKY